MKETELKIHIYGDKTLRKKSAAVKFVAEEEKVLIRKMADIMYAAGGVGLAAPQVGVNKQIITVDIGKGLLVLFNPCIKKKQGALKMEEGCLSFPGVVVKIKRSKKIFVEAINEFNQKVAFWTEDLLSRVLQHEIDHLKGKLIVDYAGILKKMEIRRKFKKSKEE